MRLLTKSFQGGPELFKSGVTASLYKSFISSYQSFDTQKSQSTKPFVYVDQSAVKLITDVLGKHNVDDEGVFAVSVAEDGWVEFLALFEN
ncbi:MAG: hypothetical protein JNM93_10220 [Bacteriovoracaceae bacterium]|nr:hypothetical protein [Bacteriovoracaceae bacterium]